MKSIAPNIFVNDILKTISFYEILGFKIIMQVPEDQTPIWVMMTNENVSFMFQTFESLANELPQISRKNGGSLLFYIDVKNIRTFFEQIKDQVNVIKGLEKTFYGTTEFTIEDVNGYLLTFAEDEANN